MVTRNFDIFIVENGMGEGKRTRICKPNLDNCKVVDRKHLWLVVGGGSAFGIYTIFFKCSVKRPPLGSPGDLLRVAFSGLFCHFICKLD